MPLINEMCASHEPPPNVGDSTYVENTRRPVACTAAANCARAGVTIRAISGMSYATAPYDSRNTSSTSAPSSRRMFDAASGTAGSRRSVVPA